MKSFLVFSGIGCLLLGLISQSAKADQNGHIGSKACMECHEDYHKSYMNNIHGNKRAPGTPGSGSECEACHGPGALHVEEEGDEKILAFGRTSETPAKEKNAMCLQCHKGNQMFMWQGSSHDDRGLSCTECHSVHAGIPNSLAKPTQVEVCGACHKEIKGELLRQSHHPIREGKLDCSDCHNPHGTIADKLVDAQYVNMKCFECHADLRGPFLWEHPPVVEDCLSCHTAHASSRSPLLKARMPYLCQRCHSNLGHPSDLAARRLDQAAQSVYSSLKNQAYYRACLNCHRSVHGSNHPSGKSLLR